MMILFFFSSRRRHTRYIGDWSSDVCSSDLAICSCAGGDDFSTSIAFGWLVLLTSGGFACGFVKAFTPTYDKEIANRAAMPIPKIGRASCRERMYTQMLSKLRNKKVYEDTNV